MIQNLRTVIIWEATLYFIVRHEILNFKLIREHFRQTLVKDEGSGDAEMRRSFEACWGAINETTSNILRPADITSSWFWETGTDSFEAARVSFQLCCGKNDLRCLPLRVTSCFSGFEASQSGMSSQALHSILNRYADISFYFLSPYVPWF